MLLVVRNGVVAVYLVTSIVFLCHPVLPTRTSTCSYVTRSSSEGNKRPSRLSSLLIDLSGGGGESHNEKNSPKLHEKPKEPRKNEAPAAEETLHTDKPQPQPQLHPVRRKHASSVITSISDNAISDESYDLRKLIASRAHEFMNDLYYNMEEPHQHPKKLLHYVACRIPAIKHSPDSMLKIQSARQDAGVAAYCIGTVARVCEKYEKAKTSQDIASVASDIFSDRRFEQLVECVLCGVDVKKRKRQAQQQQQQLESNSMAEKSRNKDQRDIDDENTKEDIPEEQDDDDDDDDEFRKEDARMDQGISVRDACRAAWGIALLGGGHSSDSIAGTRTMDLLLALSLRTRELLLARLHMMRVAPTTRLELEQQSKLLSRDAACAMWSFACVDACTGLKSYPLFSVCCSILCQSPKTHCDLDGGFDDSKNFEVDDVVDRLAKSDETVSKPVIVATNDEEAKTNEMTDVLLDSLTPNEVTDILWALALHGTADDTNSKEGHALTVTAGALREVAFDRLVAWLRHDLAVVTSRASANLDAEVVAASSSDIPILHEITEKSSTSTVEVVDAATLLAMAEDAPTTTIAAANTEPSYNQEHQSTEIENVQVVDAATLTSSQVPNVETEIVAAANGASITLDTVPNDKNSQEGFIVETVDVGIHGSEESITGREQPQLQQLQLSTESTSGSSSLSSDSMYFSAHDLCSIAWAVTDLRDPLRFLIVDLVTEIFAGMGSSSTKDLLGFDQSNLVWAIAKCSKAAQVPPDNIDSVPPLMVSQWMAECALIQLGLQDSGNIEDDFVARLPHVLDIFQPPELSRLMWSMACVVNAHGGPHYRENRKGDPMSKLALVVLCTAKSSLSMFATEDLARIAWAFLELCDTSEFTSRTLVAEALGCILTTLETSVLRWESGQCSSASLDEKIKSNESIRFTTFFGRPRLSRLIRPMLDQRLGEYEDDDDESETFSVTETTTLPLLRDLAIDPSTLCKVSSGFCRLAYEHRDIEGAWTLLRVAVRLLTSKNGQLLRECSIHDIIRLCNTCATNQVHGEDRELIIRIFARRIVQLLNESFEEQKKANFTVAPLLARASPWELCTLYWSLGELGVRYVPTDENSRLAHRKLRLVSTEPLLTSDQIESLPLSSLTQLLHGIVSMNVISYDKTFLRSVLSALLAKVTSVSNGNTACQITELVAKVRRCIGPIYPSSSSDAATVGPVATQEPEAEEESQTNLASSTDDENAEANSVIDNLIEKENSTSVDTEVFSLCHELLATVAEKATHKVSAFTATEIRKLLLVYSVLPFQADDIVDAIEVEITRRLAALDLAASMSDGRSIQKLVRISADSSVEAGNALSKIAKDGESSKKSGIKSLFVSSEKEDETLTPENSSKMEELSDIVSRAAASACEAAARVERVGRGADVNAELTLRGVEEGAAFELGRCQELVASYRRIDFATGTRQSRYDKERRKEIAKRVLSRLFP